MNAKMEIETILSGIQERIDYAREEDYEMDEASFAYEQGMVISFNQMQAILNHIEDLKLDMLELRE